MRMDELFFLTLLFFDASMNGKEKTNVFVGFHGSETSSFLHDLLRNRRMTSLDMAKLDEIRMAHEQMRFHPNVRNDLENVQEASKQTVSRSKQSNWNPTRSFPTLFQPRTSKVSNETCVRMERRAYIEKNKTIRRMTCKEDKHGSIRIVLHPICQKGILPLARIEVWITSFRNAWFFMSNLNVFFDMNPSRFMHPKPLHVTSLIMKMALDLRKMRSQNEACSRMH